ncbi:response regulator [Xanthomonas arboricola]
MAYQLERLILVVDDEPILREMAVLLLRQRGYRTIEASNSLEALSLIKEHPEIFLIFTDLQMPGELDGYGLISFLRSGGNNLPAILTSGLGRSPRGLPPRTIFISKPYAFNDLLHKIDRLAAAP